MGEPCATRPLPVAIVSGEPYHGSYIILDSLQSSGTRGPSGGIDQITYQISRMTSPPDGLQKVTIRNFVGANDSWNIKDESAFSGLKNNYLVFNGTPITIPPGSYDIITLAAYLAAQFNAIGPDTYTVVYSTLTGMITITSSGAAFTLDLSSPNSPWFELGFQMQSYTSTSLTGDSSVNLSGPSNVFIMIREISTYNIVSFQGAGFHFVVPLTGATPSLSEANLVTLGKLECQVPSHQMLTQLTLFLFYSRAGACYPMVNFPNSFYQIVLGLS